MNSMPSLVSTATPPAGPSPITVVYFPDLDGWEKEGLRGLVDALRLCAEVHEVEVDSLHRPVSVEAPGRVFWLLSRRWERALEKIIVPPGSQVLVSLLESTPRHASLGGAFWRHLQAVVPEGAQLVAHAPLSYRFLVEMRRFDPSRCFYLPLPVGKAYGAPKAAPQEFTVGALGRFTVEQNFNFIINVAHSVISQDPQVRFELMGDGPLKTHLGDMVRELGLSRNVSVLGWQPSRFSQLDALVYAPLQNFHFIPVLEAAAHSIPVVACDFPGTEVLLEPGKSGLISPINETGSLSSHILQIRKESSLRTQLGLSLHRLAERSLSPQAVQPALEAILGGHQNTSIQVGVAA